MAAYNRAHPARRAAARRRDRLSNPAKLKAQAAANYLRHRDARLQKDAAYRVANRARLRQAGRDRYATDPNRRAQLRESAKRRAAASRQHYHANKTRKAAVNSAWRQAHPLKRRATESKRRAAKRTTAIEPVDYAAIKTRDQMRCHLCRRKVAEADLHFDHVVPLAKGGTHTATNIAVAHAVCNVRKRDRLTKLF